MWYSSGTLWTALGVVVTLLIGVLTLLVTWVRRQRLYYWAPPATPLLAPGMRGIADLEIRHDGRQLADPYLLEVTLTARGRRDIPSSAFDQGRPMVFDLGDEIVKVLQVRCSPAASLAPPVTHEDSTLRVGPELVGRHQTTTISVLVDGDRPRLVCTQPVLAQVTLIPQDPPDRLALTRMVVVLGVTALVMVGTVWVSVWVASASASVSASTLATVMGLPVAVMALALALVIMLGVRSQDPSG
jgi:hypothetical protein